MVNWLSLSVRPSRYGDIFSSFFSFFGRPSHPCHPVSAVTPVTPVTQLSCIRGCVCVCGVVKLIILTKKIFLRKWSEMARKLVKSLCWHFAPSPLRGRSKKFDPKKFSSGNGQITFFWHPAPPLKKIIPKKDFPTGNSLKWQENWSSHFYGTLPPYREGVQIFCQTLLPYREGVQIFCQTFLCRPEMSTVVR